MSKNLSELSGRGGIVDNLFEKMGKAAEQTGTVSQEELDRLADEFLVGKANTYGTITAYDFMKPDNKGKKAYVCNGSACLCAGTQDELISKLQTKLKPEEIGHMTCLGRCHENSAFHMYGHNFSGEDINQIDTIISTQAALQQKDNYNVGGNKTVLTEEIQDIDNYYKLLTSMFENGPEKTLDEVKKSNIRGRGGAGFPMGVKWDFCRKAESDKKFIICNADEGDPGAYSDRYLLEERPHSVLFGMMVGAYCMGAQWGILYIRAEYPEAIDIVENAIQELRDRNLLGENIHNSGFNFDFKVIKAKGAYICGEETALINSIEGQRPEVRTRPPFPAQQGLFNKPTIVNNVETLAAVHWILEHGGDTYASLGTDKSTGTKLVCLDSFFNKPGMYEVEMGTSLRTVIDEMGGGFKEPVKAMHIGGPLGGLVPVSKIDDLAIDFESFNTNGFLLGHASVVCIPEKVPMIKYLEHLMEFAAYESCGKCFPCRLGTTRGHEMFTKAINEGYKIDRTLLDDLLETLQQGSLCAHGGGIPLPVKNALQYFDEELSEYLS